MGNRKKIHKEGSWKRGSTLRVFYAFFVCMSPSVRSGLHSLSELINVHSPLSLLSLSPPLWSVAVFTCSYCLWGPNAVQPHPKYAPLPVLPFLSFISSGRGSHTGGQTVDCGSLISGRVPPPHLTISEFLQLSQIQTFRFIFWKGSSNKDPNLFYILKWKRRK